MDTRTGNAAILREEAGSVSSMQERSIVKKLLTTDGTYGPLVARLLLGVVMFPHGAQKLLGWFGGYGFEATMAYMTGTVGLPYLIGLAVILIESLGALLLIIGFATRVNAAFLFILFAGIIMMHFEHGFFMNWYGQKSSQGFEYHLLVLGLAGSLIFSGGGAFSADKKLGN